MEGRLNEKAGEVRAGDVLGSLGRRRSRRAKLRVGRAGMATSASWWRVGGGCSSRGQAAGLEPEDGDAGGRVVSGAVRRSGKTRRRAGDGRRAGSPLEGADGRPEPWQGTVGPARLGGPERGRFRSRLSFSCLVRARPKLT